MKNVDGQVTWSDLGTQFMKTYQELSAATTEKTSKQSSKKSSESQNRKLPMYLYLRKENGPQPVFSWETDGPWHGELMTRNTGESPNDVVVSRLSQILEDKPHQKYFLSEKACLGILNRAERRGKDLPETLKLALMRQAGLTPSIRSDPNHVPCVLDMTHANDVIRDCGDVVPTLQSRMGTGGNQVPLVMEDE